MGIIEQGEKKINLSLIGRCIYNVGKKFKQNLVNKHVYSIKKLYLQPLEKEKDLY